MNRRLKEYREMEIEETLPVQRDFPNCQKYKKCCNKDEDFWDKMNGQPLPHPPITEIESEQILHNVNGYKIDPKRDKIENKPEGFEGW